MADQFLTVTMSGWESVKQELDDVMTAMKRPIRNGLATAGYAMAPALKQHIADDWYDAWGPPKKYLRRTDYPERGPSLYEQVEEAVVRDDSVFFEYLPSGEYRSAGGMKTSDANGDDLINIIQYNRGWTFPPSLDRQGRNIMPRPFWNNFVEEMKDGLLMDAFEAGFSSTPDWTMVREGGAMDMAWDAGESIL